MPRDLGLDFESMDDEMNFEQRPKRQAPPQRGPQQGPGGRVPVRRKKNQTASIIILAVEIVVFIALVVLFFVLKGKIEDGGSSSSKQEEAVTSESSEGGSSSSGGVNVESNEFTLTCTKVQLANDVNGNPAALIYFTFVNKTDTPMSMSEVFPPSLTQNGASCSTGVELADYPTEYANKDMQVSGGQSVDCCYAFAISDLTNPLTLTIHDNYSTFTDIGSTEIPIS